VSESVNCEGWGSGLGARRRTAGVWTLGLRKITCFFFCIYSTPLNRTGSVRLGFFRFQVSETETEPNRIFFKNSNRFNRFFFTVRFFCLFVSRFSRFNQFLGFFAHP
jgi:hypothetical protein